MRPYNMKERLQKVMAEAGVASRRQCEQLILDEFVRVNGKIVFELPCFVDPQQDRIVIDGKRLGFENKVYFLLHKPKKVVCTNYDPSGRTRAVDLLGKVKERVFPVGRLDAETKGALIMTNDGDLANQLTHPSFGVPKTYLAQVHGTVSGEDIQKLRKGIWMAEGKAQIENVKIAKRGKIYSYLEITLREGRNRQIRRMLSRIGHPIKELTRTHIGPISLRGLGPRNFRPLTDKEIASLKKLSQPDTSRKSGPSAVEGKRPTAHKVTKPKPQRKSVTPKPMAARAKRKR